MVMIMRMVMVVRMWMIVVVVVIMRMVVVLVSVAIVMLLGMGFRMRSSFVFKPKLRNRVTYHASQCTQLSQRIPDAILDIARQAKHKSRSAGLDKGDRREEDQNSNDAGRNRVPSGPAVVLGQKSRDDDCYRAKRIGKNMKEDTLHVFVVV